MNLTKQLYIKFRHDLGGQLRQQRLLRGWSLEEAANKLNLGNPRVLECIENGSSKRFFLFFALIVFFDCQIEIQLTKA